MRVPGLTAPQGFGAFWRRTTALPRAALILAALSGVVVAGTGFGLSADGPLASLYAIHVTVMLLGFILFLRIVQHHWLAMWRHSIKLDPVPVPRTIRILTVVAFAGLLLAFGVTATTYPEGGPELREGQYVWTHGETVIRASSEGEYSSFQSASLRVFSLSWLFFSLLISWAGHVISDRLRQLRAGAFANPK